MRTYIAGISKKIRIDVAAQDREEVEYRKPALREFNAHVFERKATHACSPRYIQFSVPQKEYRQA